MPAPPAGTRPAWRDRGLPAPTVRRAHPHRRCVPRSHLPGGHNVLSSTLARACPVRRPWTHLSSNLDLCEMRHSRLPETPPPAVGTVEETSAGGAPAAPPPGKEYAWARG